MPRRLNGFMGVAFIGRGMSPAGVHPAVHVRDKRGPVNPAPGPPPRSRRPLHFAGDGLRVLFGLE
jgi:hypothetical protein